MALRTWINGNSANWTIGADWTAGIPAGAGDAATVGSALQTAAQIVTISTLVTVASVSLGSNTSNILKNTTLKLSAGTLSTTGGISVGKFSVLGGVGSINAGAVITGIGTIAAGAGGTDGLLLITGAGLSTSTGTSSTLVVNSAASDSTLELNVSGVSNKILSIAALQTHMVLALDQSDFTDATALTISGGTLRLGATAATAQIIDIAGITLNSGSITGRGTVAAAITFTGGTVVATAGSLEISTTQSSTSAKWVIDDAASGSVLQFGGAAGTGTLAFSGTTNVGKLVAATTNALSNLTISNFGGNVGNSIIVAGVTSEVVGGGFMTLFAGGSVVDTIALTGSVPADGTYSGLTGGTISAACYLEGTQVLTDVGEVAVQDLRIGEHVITQDGAQPVRWIGTRAYLARMINEHHRDGLMPVRFSAGSLANNVPTRDLFVSPEHMMALGGVLVAAHNLVNGSTITRHADIDVVKYFHIELDQHAVIFAEGAAAESYLDTGNRNMFTNVLDYAELGIPVGSTVACLPIVSEGPQLAAIRAGIADRAAACGFTTSADADLHLLVDGVTIYPSVINGESFSFDIAQSASDVQIVSRSAVPAEIDPASADRRRLGVAMGGLTLRGNGLSIDVLAGEKLLAEGFYPADAGHRWTNGAAPIPAALLALMDGAFSVTVQLVGTGMRYSVADHGGVFALASVRAPRSAGAQRRVA
jgi:hypothetical protein